MEKSRLRKLLEDIIIGVLSRLTLKEVAATPENIIIGVLSRLPVKTLLRFESVCKTWCNLIKTPSFQSMHHNVTTSQLLIYTQTATGAPCPGLINMFSFRSYDESASVLSPDLDIPETLSDCYRFAGPCNGIVCCYSGDDDSKVFLCNPARREFKELPPTSFEFGTSSISLWYDFGSPNMYDFKVICMLMEKDVSSPHFAITAELFTLSSNTWRQVDCGLGNKILFGDDGDVHDRGVFYANSFHYMVHQAAEDVILCCDTDTERFRTMGFPHGVSHCSLMVFKEFLSSFDYLRDETKLLQIWIMKDYGIVESWTKLYTIEKSSFEIAPFSKPLRFNGDDLVVSGWSNEKNLVTWNPNSLNLEVITILGFKAPSRVAVYKETLFSIT